MGFKDNILLYTITPLIILMIVASFHRFMVTYDYDVTYEGDCDPYNKVCYIYCENEECTEPLYFSYITRRASALLSLCGDDISECEAAYICAPEDDSCSISFCDPEINKSDSCENLSASHLPTNKHEISRTKEVQNETTISNTPLLSSNDKI